MDACVLPDLLPLDDALSTMLAAVQPVTAREIIELPAALDRVLAENIIAPINVPGADNSAMDGYAIRHQDAMKELTVVGESLAGHAFSGDLQPNQAVRITTGAWIPRGADTVVMQENISRCGNKICIDEIPTQGDNIRRAGEDIAHGSLVLSAGRLLTALDLGLLASLGIGQVAVFRRVKITVLTTGDELLAAGTKYQVGKIYDSNRPLLSALLTRLPTDVVDLGIIPDKPDALRTAFSAAMADADLVISTGGVSVGDADYTKDILSEAGDICFWRIAMKPGKPFAFGVLGRNSRARPCWFCGLPGNPVSTAVTYHQLVVPAVRRLAGETLAEPVVIKAVAAKPLKKFPGRMDFQRGVFSTLGGTNYVESAGPQSSGVLSSMNKANCLIRLERERGAVAEGELVDVILFDRFIQ